LEAGKSRAETGHIGAGNLRTAHWHWQVAVDKLSPQFSILLFLFSKLRLEIHLGTITITFVCIKTNLKYGQINGYPVDGNSLRHIVL
jgi:hypothetical protein